MTSRTKPSATEPLIRWAAPPPDRTNLAVFFCVFAFYLLTGSRERPWGDAQVMWDVAESLVLAGRINIAFEWPPMSHRGPDGLVYSQYALFASLTHVPGAALLRLLADGSESRAFWWPVCAHLAPAAAVAWGTVSCLGIAQSLGYSRRIASASALVLALATGAWVYARYPYSEALQLGCFAWFARMSLSAYAQPSRRTAMWLGVASGALVNTKLVFAVAVAIVMLGFLLTEAPAPRLRRRAVLVGSWLLGLAPFAAAFLLYNAARWGSPFATGYDYTIDLYREAPWTGTFGLLFSPGKSVFLYNPPLIVALFGWPRLFAAAIPGLAWLVAATLAVMFSYAAHLSWTGGYCWGPRYWIFALPVAMLGFLPVASRVCSPTKGVSRWLRVGALSTFVVAGCGVQVLGNTLYWDHFIRVAKEARTRWLGQPDRAGAAIAERGRGHCDSCFEDLHPLVWLPPFSPIAGHAWLASEVLRGSSWEAAEVHAPWHRYTTLRLDIQRTYRRARLDTWFLVWMEDVPAKHGQGVALAALWGATLVVTAGLWARSLQSARARRRA